jgi:hypothetical protein
VNGELQQTVKLRNADLIRQLEEERDRRFAGSGRKGRLTDVATYLLIERLAQINGRNPGKDAPTERR